ncbi:MAG TPA: pseudaminic acid biosynthesis-associated methylase [Noviherbaspirillum sp.]|nr:pseudaminic acid biosynthesis-associated methylase [Noviherbaspirillum sp.]
MANNYGTEQEEFWAGEFGDHYIERNHGKSLIAANVAFFRQVLARTHSVRSVIEFGANIGMNMEAIRILLPEVELAAIEINAKAAEVLQKRGNIEVHQQSILDFTPRRNFDLALIKGVLIHMNPDVLPKVYDLLHQSSARYICVAEYYNPSPTEVLYRGNEGKLFKRDFAGEMLDRFPGLRLIDYGFLYHRDSNFPHDDITWFLLEKTF